MKKTPLILLIMLVGAYANSYADSDVTQLETIVVEATRSDNDYKKFPASVDVLTNDMLRKNPKNGNFYDVIGNVAGVHTDHGGGMGWPTLKVRGETPTVLFNGLNINPYITASPFNIMTAGIGAVEQIEILKGAQAATQGSGSMSGAINVVMQKGSADNPFVKTHLEGGSDDTLNGSFLLSGGKDKFFWVVDYAQKKSGDYNTPKGKISYTDSKFKNLYTRLDYRPTKQHEISLETLYGDGRYRTGGKGYFYINDGMNNKIWQNEPETSGIFLRYNGDFDIFNLAATTGYMENSLDYIWGNAPYDISSFLNKVNTAAIEEDSYIADVKSRIKILDNDLLNAHLNYLHKKTDAKSKATGFFPFAYTSTDKQNSLVGQLESKPLKYLFLVAGVRYDAYKRDGISTDHTGINIGASIYPFAGTEHNWTTFWVSYSEAFKMPSANFLYLPPAIGGNPDLRYEESSGWEIGVKQEISHWAELSASYFYTDYTNRIVFDLASFKLNNVGQSKAKGVEVNLMLYPTEHLVLYSNYINMERIDDKTGDRLYASINPDSKIAFGLLLDDFYGLNFSIEGAYYLDYKIDKTRNHPMEDKAVLNSKLSYNIQYNDKMLIEPYLTVTNLTDETVYSAGDTPGLQPGRQFFAGVSLTYHF